MNKSLWQRHLIHPLVLIVTLWFVSKSASALRTPRAFARARRRHQHRTLTMAILDSPSAQRNKEPIWNVLSEIVLPLLPRDEPLSILEIAAGCGVHTEHFASKLSEREQSFQYYPTDLDPVSRVSIQGCIQQSKLVDNVNDPLSLTLDANGIVEEETAAALDSQGDLDLILCINMIHISPWDATRGLMKLAGNKLRKGGVLFCYGPFKVGGTAVASNL